MDWHGWTEESGITKLEWFVSEKIACRCTIPCENCGFNYLDINGQELTDSETPLCGER
jgi:hypothetical protein